MYTIEEYDKEKSKVLKYILYKKRSKQEVKNKFYNTIESEMLDDIIEELEENGYINDNNYIERAVKEYIALNNLSLKEVIKKQNAMEEEAIIQFLMKKGYKTSNIRQAIELLNED